MVLPPVVVEISAADASADLRATLIEACSRAVQDTQCTESAPSADPSDVAAVVIVSWQPDGSIRIEVGRKPDQMWHARVLRFDEAAERNEVYTSVGFAIGTFVGRLQEENQLELDPSRPAPPPETGPPPSASPTRETSRVSYDDDQPTGDPPAVKGRSRWIGGASLLVGSGRTFETWRVGGAVSVAWAHRSGFVLGGTGVYSTAPRPRGYPRDSWLGGSVGPGYEVSMGLRTVLSFSAELGVERYESLVTNLRTGLDDSGNRWVGTTRERLQLVLHPGPRTTVTSAHSPGLGVPTRSQFGLVVGTELTAPFGKTSLRILDQEMADPAPIRLAVFIGFRSDPGRGR